MGLAAGEDRASNLSPGGCDEGQVQREPHSELERRELGCQTRILGYLGSEGLRLET